VLDDDRDYHAVRNSPGQYSIWPADRRPPAGWWREGEAVPRDECTAAVARRWGAACTAPSAEAAHAEA
jgi:MbtH protein